MTIKQSLALKLILSIFACVWGTGILGVMAIIIHWNYATRAGPAIRECAHPCISFSLEYVLIVFYLVWRTAVSCRTSSSGAFARRIRRKTIN